MLTDKQTFRLGFLQKCADSGMTAEQTLDLVERTVDFVKAAQQEKASQLPATAAAGGGLSLAGLMSGLGAVGSGLGSAASALGSYAVPVALGGPPVVGAIGGHLLARSTDVDDETIKAIRKRELIDEIRRNRQILEQKRRTYRPTA